MSELIYIADPKVLAIPVRENGERWVDIKKTTLLRYGPVPECDETKEDYTKMRQSVFDRLLLAQARLPAGWFFRIYEGFRRLHVQKMLFDQEYQRVSDLYPNQGHDFWFHEATRMASPVINFDGSSNIPPHNTGAAVDIELVDEEGCLVDMGMAAKDWQKVDVRLCLTTCDFISEEAKFNRQILLSVMEAEGFVNYPTEWWHFSYGDRYWAYVKKQQYAIYGSMESSGCLKTEVNV